MGNDERMYVFIPTRGRMNRQITLQQIPANWLERTILVVDEDERYLYDFCSKVLPVFPSYGGGIHSVRQFITDWCFAQGIGKMFQIDDDLTFFRRKGTNDWHLRKLEAGEMDELLWMVSDFLDHYAHLSISIRSGNNRSEQWYAEVGRSLQALAYRVDILKTNSISFLPMQFMEDFHVTLSLLECGYPNLIMYEWAIDQKGSNVDGGCSLYRNEDTQRASAYKLAALHNPFVKVVEKKSKNWHGGMETRTDVVVSWKKAYQSAGARKSL